MPQTPRKWINADLKKPEPKFDLTPVDAAPEQKFDLTPAGYDTVDLTNHQTPYTGYPERQPVQAPEDTNLGEDVWSELNRPHSGGAFERLGRNLETKLSDPNNAHMVDSLLDNLPVVGPAMPALRKIFGDVPAAQARGAVAGSMVGLGKQADSFTSDLGLLSLMPEGMIGKYAPATAKALSLANRAGGAGFAVHAGNKLANAKDLGEAGEALTEGAGGLAAFLHAGPPKEVPTQGQKLGEHFDSKIKAPTNISTPLDLEQLRQPKLRAVDQNPEPTQRDIFTDYDNRPPKWRGQANQLQLAPETSFAPPIDGTQQKLDLVPGPVNMPNEFLPDNSYMHDPSNQGAPTNLFDNSQTLPANRPTNNGRLRMIDNTLPTDEEMSTFRNKRNQIKENARPLVGDTSEIPNDDNQVHFSRKFSDDPLFEGSEGKGLGKDSFEEQWNQSRKEADHLGIDWRAYDNLDQLQWDITKKTAQETMRTGKNPLHSLTDEEGPSYSRSEQGGIKIGQDVRNSAEELTSGYNGPLPGIMMREALQNAKDAVEHLGEHGRVFADTIPDPNDPAHRTIGFEVHDNGKGMDRKELETVFSDLHSSGKVDQEGATGGKGIGKATFMLGGKHFSVETVKEVNGQKIKTTLAGTPEEFMTNVDPHEEVVPNDTPTGTKIKTLFTDDQIKNNAGGHAILALDKITKFSRDISGKYKTYDNPFDTSFGSTDKDVHIGNTDILGHEVNVSLPPGERLGDKSYIQVHVLNNGMYQYTKPDHYIGEKIADMPDNVVVNIKPSAKERTKEYPFPTQRESLKQDVQTKLEEFIKKTLVEPQKARRQSTVQQLYDSMTRQTLGGVRDTIIFDPGNRLTSEELKSVESSAVIQGANRLFDHVLDEALKATGRTKWQERLEGVGTMFADKNFYGVHIPNPATDKSSILINLFDHLREANNNPEEAAWNTISTLFHEAGHIGKRSILDHGKPRQPLAISEEEMNDPRVGKFMKMYLENVKHGDETINQGHGVDWLARTAEVMTAYGPRKTIDATERLTRIFGDKQTGGYNAETQRLLSLYEERGGRPSLTNDYLSPTGIKSESSKGRTGDISSGADSDIFGDAPKGDLVRPTNPKGDNLTTAFNKPIKWQPTPAPKETITQIQREVPQSEIPKKMQQAADALVAAKDNPEITRDEKENLLEKTLNFQRTLLTSADLSAPGRQGLPLIGRKEWWTSWKPMMEALGSEKAYQTSMESIRNDPSGLFSPGEKGKSFANEAGLSLTDTLDHREELFRSKWAEDLKATGWFVKPSVRAYTAYLNKLRADTFKNMVKTAGAENNIVVARQIADFINVATGRGSLGVFESAAKPLAQVFFSPRLTASRMQMYTRTFNPMFYKDMPPVVRQEQLKSMLLLAGTGLLIGQLSKMAGATVNLHDPLNSDFGKIRFGNTRIDPFAGHQQFLVAAARLAMGKTTSSTSGKTTSLTTGKFGMPSRASVFGNFMKNKLAPIPSFVWSWMEGKDFDGTPFNAKKELMSRTIPIVTQDLHDIWKEQPALVPGLFASASSFIGAGVQTYGR